MLPLFPSSSKNKTAQLETRFAQLTRDHGALSIPSEVSAVNRYTNFAVALNQGQTVTKRSFPAILIKDYALLSWFECSKPWQEAELCAAIDLAPKVIHRLLHKLTDQDSFSFDGQHYWPSQRLITKITAILEHSGIACRTRDDALGLQVLEPVFSRLHGVSQIIGRFQDQLSGRYLCVENVLWRQELLQPNQSMRCSDISKISQVPKSTLTTMLDQARGLNLVKELTDASDARVSRWKINMQHPMNIARYEILRRSFKDPEFQNINGLQHTGI